MSPSREMEEKAKKLLYKAGEEGVLQSELWKELGASSREGSRLALKFEEDGVVDREKELNDGRWTYRLYYKKKPVTLTSIEDCPCLVCPDIDKCFVGGGRDPYTCLYLSSWIDPRMEQIPRLPEDLGETEGE
jgi:DNA-binding Lrp family transcriptional regulator